MFSRASQIVRPLVFHLGKRKSPGMVATGLMPRCVCDRAILKMDKYDQEKIRFHSRLKETDAFWLRFLTLSDTKNLNEEDLKMAWVLAEEEHLPEVIKSSETFLEQMSSATHSFKFCSVMMRTCYRLRNAEAALQIFQSPVLTKHFRQDTMSVIILLDLLIDEGKLEDAVNVVRELMKREWVPQVRSPVVTLLYMVALSKQGTSQALQSAYEFASKLSASTAVGKIVHNMVHLMALKQEDANILHKLKRRDVKSDIDWNLKVQGFAVLSDWQHVIAEISKKRYRLFQDTFKLIKSRNPELGASLPKAIETTLNDQFSEPLKHIDVKTALAPKTRFYE